MMYQDGHKHVVNAGYAACHTQSASLHSLMRSAGFRGGLKGPRCVNDWMAVGMKV